MLYYPQTPTTIIQWCSLLTEDAASLIGIFNERNLKDQDTLIEQSGCWPYLLIFSGYTL